MAQKLEEKVVCFLPSSPASRWKLRPRLRGNPAAAAAAAVTKGGAQAAAPPPPGWQHLPPGDNRGHPLISPFLSSAVLPFCCLLVSQTTSWGPPPLNVLSRAGAPRGWAWKPGSAAFLPRAHPSAALIGRFWAIPQPGAGRVSALRKVFCAGRKLEVWGF